MKKGRYEREQERRLATFTDAELKALAKDVTTGPATRSLAKAELKRRAR